MAQKNCFCGVTVSAVLFLGAALVIVVAVSLQALYLREFEFERKDKSGLESHAEFAVLRASKRAAMEGDFAVLERDAANAPVRLHLPIETAMERALETARMATRR